VVIVHNITVLNYFFNTINAALLSIIEKDLKKSENLSILEQ